MTVAGRNQKYLGMDQNVLAYEIRLSMSKMFRTITQL